jgi:hypothetical protein
VQVNKKNMELTGVLYGFYSNKAMPAVFEKLKTYAESINFKFQHDSFEGNEDIFFYKDENMRRYHDDKGYNTELNGEGCFYIEGKNAKLNGIATLFEFEGKSDFEPFDINLAFTQVYYYVLTVPHIVEDDEFSRKIHHAVQNILTTD